MAATALTGSLGWTGLHPFQLGGPPLTNTFARTLPPLGSPLIAHVYQNDGVTFVGSMSVLTLPTIANVTANGGFEQVQLSVANRSVSVSQGNVIRLTIQGGDGSIVFSGIVEDLPDVIAADDVEHLILLTAFGFELDDVHSTSVYTSGVDISQIVRDAVAQTFHCSCDQVSVPPSLGIVVPTDNGSTLDFRDQTLKDQIDTARAIAGANFYWHVDEFGRVWFQFMGSGAVYTVVRGQHYQKRTSAASIQDRKNRITIIGGVPQGGSANVTAVYNGSSQSSIGIRALTPPLTLPNVTSQGVVTSIANNIGVILDRIWNRVQLVIQRPFTQRIHAAQPGGAMIRYWEPSSSPFAESEVGSGGYSGPYIAQRVEYDGTLQNVTAGDIPVTSQTDVQNMVNTMAARTSANDFYVSRLSINLPNQVFAGSVLSGTSAVILPGGTSIPASQWSMNQIEIAAFDGNGIARVEMGNLAPLGNSTGGWKFRGTDATNAPVFDSDQVFGDRVMKSLGIANGPTSPPQSFTSTSFSAISSTSLSFTIARSCNIYAPFLATGRVNTNNGNVGFVRANLVGVTTSGNENFGVLANFAQTSSGWIFVSALAPGSYTIELDAAVNATQTFDVFAAVVQVFQVGG